ncbi:MAG: RIP metalloprotease [Actinomycetota bacterium]
MDEDKKAPWALVEPEDVAPGEERTNPFGLVMIIGLFALLWFWAGPRYFLVVLGLMIMIFLHELGHFVTARWTGMKATQFFLFMGPRIWSFRRGETEYGLRSLPLGAFVKIVGMNNLDPTPPEDEHRAYRNKSYPRKMLVITAGSMMHFIQALILFIVLSSVIGSPDYDRWTISAISRLETGETPSVEAGLVPGETILSVDGTSSTNFRDLQEYLRDRPGEEVALEVQGLDDSVRTVSTELATVPLSNGDEIGFLGITPATERARTSPVEGMENFGIAFWESLKAIPRLLSPTTYLNLVGLMFQGQEEVSLTSEEAQNRPVSMVGAVRLAGSASFDWAFPVSMLAFINIFVGIFNLVPLLPLDGGHAAIATYERIRSRDGKPYHMDVAKLLPLTYVVIAMLGFLMLTTIWLDIFRPIG